MGYKKRIREINIGIYKDIKEISDWNKRRKQRKEQKAKEVNQNPTEEQLKNNKKGKLAFLWTFISIIVYLVGFGIVLSAWQENIAIGIMALIFALIITPMAHKKAVNLAREQRKINGKGLMALIFATLLPSIILVGGFFFLFVFGGLYNFI